MEAAKTTKEKTLLSARNTALTNDLGKDNLPTECREARGNNPQFAGIWQKMKILSTPQL